MSHPVSVRVVLTMPSGIEIPCELGEVACPDAVELQRNAGLALIAAGEEMVRQVAA